MHSKSSRRRSPARRRTTPPACYIDIDKNPLALALSPDNHWGIVVSEHGYTLLRSTAPDDIESLPVDAAMLDAARSRNTTAYLLRDQVLETAPLDTLDAHARRPDARAGRHAVAGRAQCRPRATGVVVLDDNHLVFFDPAKLEQDRRIHPRRAARSPVFTS